MTEESNQSETTKPKKCDRCQSAPCSLTYASCIEADFMGLNDTNPPEPKEAGDWEDKLDKLLHGSRLKIVDYEQGLLTVHPLIKDFIRSLLAEREKQAYEKGEAQGQSDAYQINDEIRVEAKRQLISSIREKIEKLRKEEKPVKIFTDPNKLIHMLDLHEAKGYNSALAEFLTFLEEK